MEFNREYERTIANTKENGLYVNKKGNLIYIKKVGNNDFSEHAFIHLLTMFYTK